jgi:hypothetical protein
MVRDLKTGKAKARSGQQAGPTPTIDAQLGLYAAVTKRLAKAWGVPAKLGIAYVYINEQNGRHRAFIDDFAVLETATEQWLQTAVALLQESAFPRTPNGDDCGFCDFKPLCGLGAQIRAVDLLCDADGALGHFWEMKS